MHCNVWLLFLCAIVTAKRIHCDMDACHAIMKYATFLPSTMAFLASHSIVALALSFQTMLSTKAEDNSRIYVSY